MTAKPPTAIASQRLRCLRSAELCGVRSCSLMMLSSVLTCRCLSAVSRSARNRWPDCCRRCDHAHSAAGTASSRSPPAFLISMTSTAATTSTSSTAETARAAQRRHDTRRRAARCATRLRSFRMGWSCRRPPCRVAARLRHRRSSTTGRSRRPVRARGRSTTTSRRACNSASRLCCDSHCASVVSTCR